MLVHGHAQMLVTAENAAIVSCDELAHTVVGYLALHSIRDVVHLLLTSRIPWRRCRTARATADEVLRAFAATPGSASDELLAGQLLLNAFAAEDEQAGELDAEPTQEIRRLLALLPTDAIVALCVANPDVLVSAVPQPLSWSLTLLGRALDEHKPDCLASALAALSTASYDGPAMVPTVIDTLPLLGAFGKASAEHLTRLAKTPASSEASVCSSDFGDARSSSRTEVYLECVCKALISGSRGFVGVPHHDAMAALVWLYLTKLDVENPTDGESGTSAHPVEMLEWTTCLVNCVARDGCVASARGYLNKLTALVATGSPFDASTLLSLADTSSTPSPQRKAGDILVQLFAWPRIGRLDDALKLLMTIMPREPDQFEQPHTLASVTLAYAQHVCGSDPAKWSQLFDVLRKEATNDASVHSLLMATLDFVAALLEPREFIKALSDDLGVADVLPALERAFPP